MRRRIDPPIHVRVTVEPWLDRGLHEAVVRSLEPTGLPLDVRIEHGPVGIHVTVRPESPWGYCDARDEILGRVHAAAAKTVARHRADLLDAAGSPELRAHVALPDGCRPRTVREGVLDLLRPAVYVPLRVVVGRRLYEPAGRWLSMPHAVGRRRGAVIVVGHGRWTAESWDEQVVAPGLGAIIEDLVWPSHRTLVASE